MKKRMIRTLSLAMLVGMMAISAKTVRAEAGASLEREKQQSGVEFGEITTERGDSSAVRASGDSKTCLRVAAHQIVKDLLDLGKKIEELGSKADSHGEQWAPRVWKRPELRVETLMVRGADTFTPPYFGPAYAHFASDGKAYYQSDSKSSI